MGKRHKHHERPLSGEEIVGYLAIGALIGTLFYSSIYFGIVGVERSNRDSPSVNYKINEKSLDSEEFLNN